MKNTGLEIERWFLPRYNLLPPLRFGSQIIQGYLAESPTVRVRIKRTWWGWSRAYLTLKRNRVGISRQEHEFRISVRLARELLAHTVLPLVKKTRYLLPYGGEGNYVWEVDVFHGDNNGLIKIEIELDREDVVLSLPPWIYTEVTYHEAYSGKNLAKNPFCSWSESDRNEGR